MTNEAGLPDQHTNSHPINCGSPKIDT